MTDERLPPGPLRLAEHQKRIIDAALSRKEDGTFKYSTVIYSAPKKSGKSAITSAVVLYMAYHNPDSYIACISNDLKQSSNRLYGPIRTCFRLHREQGGIFKDVKDTQSGVVMPNFTQIEPIPADAASEAGSQPMMTAWSELWGFMTESKTRLYTEMTIPPTLYGRAIRWVESYAGFTGTSTVLEGLYNTGVVEGEPHPDFDDLQGKRGPVVTTNERAGIFCYWDTEPRMIWQNDVYYREQSASMPHREFKRVHHNEWVSDLGSFVEKEWWDDCIDTLLPVLQDGDKTPMVVGIDMAVTRDCAGMVGVTRHPIDPKQNAAARVVRIVSPASVGGVIDQEKYIRPIIEEWHRRFNVICWVYDPHQMAKLAQDMTREGYGWFKPLSQGNPRAIADKQLYDMIVHKQFRWNPYTTEGDVNTLYEHITKAGAITRGDTYRLEKLTDALKIDGAVAASMALYIAMLHLNLTNREGDIDSLVTKLQKRQITLNEFSERVRQIYPLLQDAVNEQ